MNRFNRNNLEPLNIEYEDEEVFGEVVPQTNMATTKSLTTSGYSAKTMSRQTSTRSVHSAGSTDGNKFVFEVKEQSSTNLLPSMGFKRKWSKRKKDLKLRYCMSRIVRKPDFCLCENKGADQLRGNREADQRLCFRYTDSIFPLLLISEISSF